MKASGRRLEVGDVVSSKQWGAVRVTSLVSHKIVEVQFLATGNVQEVTKYKFKAGTVADKAAIVAGVQPAVAKKQVTIDSSLASGDTFKSNLWGDVSVVTYINNTEVRVLFTESGNTATTSKHSLLHGLVRDKQRQASETKARRTKEAVSRAVFAGVVSLLRMIRQESIDARRLLRVQQRDDIEATRMHELVQRLFTHPEFGDYHITGRNGAAFFIVWTDSGNISSHELRTIEAGRVSDLARYSLSDLASRKQEHNADFYIKNRERLLHSAKSYQRANPEKTRVFNSRRRGRQLAAKGTHTHIQVMALLAHQKSLCTACSKPLADGKHLDHIMPYALGGSNSIDNLQWLCPFCNLSKNAKHPDVWARIIESDSFKARRELVN